MPLTLLFLATTPTDTARLRVDQEYRAPLQDEKNT